MSRREIPGVGRFEAAHGRQKEIGKTMTFVAVPDGIRPIAPLAVVPPAPRQGGRFTAASAREAAHRRRELAKMPDFAKKEIEFIPTQDFAPFDSGRRDLLTRRIEEIVSTYGGASAGLMTTLRGYAWLVSFAEFYATRAARTGDDEDADRARRFFKDASIEMAKVMEIARVEAASRPRGMNSHQRLLVEISGSSIRGGARPHEPKIENKEI
jgi:hypothetical protein